MTMMGGGFQFLFLVLSSVFPPFSSVFSPYIHSSFNLHDTRYTEESVHCCRHEERKKDRLREGTFA